MNQQITMFLIRRKADGLYHSSRSNGSRANWTQHISKARPFKTISGAKTSLQWNDWKTVSTIDICKECKFTKPASHLTWKHREHCYSDRNRLSRWSRGKSLSKEEHFQQWITRKGCKPCWIESRMTKKENPFEIVKVQMTLAETI